jgi:hypothetical protein
MLVRAVNDDCTEVKETAVRGVGGVTAVRGVGGVTAVRGVGGVAAVRGLGGVIVEAVTGGEGRDLIHGVTGLDNDDPGPGLRTRGDIEAPDSALPISELMPSKDERGTANSSME